MGRLRAAPPRRRLRFVSVHTASFRVARKVPSPVQNPSRHAGAHLNSRKSLPPVHQPRLLSPAHIRRPARHARRHENPFPRHSSAVSSPPNTSGGRFGASVRPCRSVLCAAAGGGHVQNVARPLLLVLAELQEVAGVVLVQPARGGPQPAKELRQDQKRRRRRSRRSRRSRQTVSMALRSWLQDG